jgi:poly-gamma-glutamate synthesis protein (capsule biosynthesis protein)
VWGLVAWLLPSCVISPATGTPTGVIPLQKISPAVTPTRPDNDHILSTPPLTLAPSPIAPIRATRIWIDQVLPSNLLARLEFGSKVDKVLVREQADVVITPLRPGEKPANQLDWFYALTARFSAVEDGITTAQFKLIWDGDQTEHVLIMAPDTLAVFSAMWGAPSGNAVRVLPQEDLLQTAWDQPETYALIPFEEIEPRWKVLSLDGLSPLDKMMDVRLYPLKISAAVFVRDGDEGKPGLVKLPPSNRESGKLITLAMTGVTALVRGTARMMNEKGVMYPAQDIGDLLSNADLTHISNEVSFNQDCSPARAASPEAIFCSAPEYIRLLEAVGTDIVELTGNHNLDKGATAYRYTFEQYQQRGWLTFGGGLDIDQAKQAVVVERGNTRLAFLGCNWAGPDIAWAGVNKPGAAPCDINWMEKEVTRLRGEGYLPIVTFQAYETEDYMPAPMKHPSDFSRVAIAGAVIVSGSQAHFPQGFKFEGERFIHYGLGNLFFDQMQPPATRKAFIDRHIFYDGVYIGVELITTKLEEASRPRLMSPEERSVFLSRVFGASGWGKK